MASSTVKFGAVTVGGPDGFTSVRLLPMFVTDLSANHTRWTYQTTATKKSRWRISLDNLTTAQKNALETFFTDVAKGPTNTFIYTHTDGTSYSGCRFVDTELDFSRMDDRTWSTQVEIEMPGSINS